LPDCAALKLSPICGLEGFLHDGRPLEALHVLDIALAAVSDSGEGRAVKREALRLLLEQSGGKNLWERMWIASEIPGLDA
jgi:hypothetical protein